MRTRLTDWGLNGSILLAPDPSGAGGAGGGAGGTPDASPAPAVAGVTPAAAADILYNPDGTSKTPDQVSKPDHMLTAEEKAAREAAAAKAPDETKPDAKPEAKPDAETAEQVAAREKAEDEALDKAIEEAKTAKEKAEAYKAKADKEAEREAAKSGEQALKVTDLEMPEGFVLDERAAEVALPVLNELKLNKEQANKVTQAYVKVKQDEIERWEGMKADWLKEAKADPEIGGDKFDKQVGLARKAINKLSNTPEQAQEARMFLETSGGGNHRAMIRLLARAGALISDDDPVHSSTAAPARKKDAAETLYG